jgi:ankyrin repeat protein
VLELLIAANADLDKARTDDGRTPMFAAAMNGRKAIVRQLIAAGADTCLATVRGDTPLDIAERKGHTATVALLAGSSNHE